MKIPKTITGIGVVLLGAAVHFIPAVGQIASPYIMSAGAGMIGIGGLDKTIRAIKGKDPMENEKAVVNKLKGVKK